MFGMSQLEAAFTQVRAHIERDADGHADGRLRERRHRATDQEAAARLIGGHQSGQGNAPRPGSTGAAGTGFYHGSDRFHQPRRRLQYGRVHTFGNHRITLRLPHIPPHQSRTVVSFQSNESESIIKIMPFQNYFPKI